MVYSPRSTKKYRRVSFADQVSGGPLLCILEVKNLGVIDADDFLSFRQYQVGTSNVAGVLTRVRPTILCIQREMFLPSYEVLARPLLDPCVKFWAHMDYLDMCQIPATSMMAGTCGESYARGPLDPGHCPLERRRSKGDLTQTPQILRGLTVIAARDLLGELPCHKWTWPETAE